ncbi:Rossmann-like and DUF2520 domain-containing protein [Dokdonia sp. Hel_I_53]|uniref:Rossmann-like and DUF2520 domain-containing protein n=1 Tax=Dokdonia sp. Hel_I_53 TaxID=1566287 RepID=UPI00119BE564|nr:DUF2520 domain-containing protein [Dokdonia sp. Hel_I_53]TVZ51537.1 putative short-subunit dehydrogenase-like oxidoreductase (DUF2520 family) [Dokdonia sp. Hel_I_53]
MTTINIIGTGNVAWHLARAFGSKNEVIVMQIAGRNHKKLEAFKDFTRELVSISQLVPADVTIVAVSDDSINNVYNKIPFQDQLVVHTSGFTEMLSRKHTSNHTGVFYPLQSFSKEDTELSFKEIPILIEAADDKNEKTLRVLADVISDNVQVINSNQRKHLHLAAVFANNFTNYCYTIAEDICKQNEIPFDTLHPLLLKTSEKAIQNGPKQSQTGPAKRNDLNVINTQQELIKDPTHKRVYETITKAIQHLYGEKL